MLSVCIPVYNYDVRPLVKAIADEAASLPTVEVEIVCIDDHSDAEYIAVNQSIAEYATLIRLDANIGRARIRNLFLEHARGKYLLFLDNDMVVSDGFLQRYLDTMLTNPAVVVGGIAYDKRYNDDEHRLRYLYAQQAECRPLAERQADPYRSFMTGNFMIRRDILEHTQFDERITGYGHEDTLFGYRLRQQAIPITHIDNPAINGQIEINVDFLNKTVEAVRNMAVIYSFMQSDRVFCRSVRLIHAYRRLQHWHLTGIAYGLFRLLKRPLESHFISGTNISVSQLNFYKLGIFINSLEHNNKQE